MVAMSANLWIQFYAIPIPVSMELMLTQHEMCSKIHLIHFAPKHCTTLVQLRLQLTFGT